MDRNLIHADFVTKKIDKHLFQDHACFKPKLDKIRQNHKATLNVRYILLLEKQSKDKLCNVRKVKIVK